MKLFAFLCSIMWLSVMGLNECRTNDAHHAKPVKHVISTTSHPTDEDGVISGNSTGILVLEGWMRRYKILETKHSTIPEDEKIYMEGDKYRISLKVADHFNEMVRQE